VPAEGLLELDGSHLEGGGQILRTAVGLSAVTGRPCRVVNVRKGRKTPGLRAQHLRGIQAVGELYGARLAGAKLGSTQVEFWPRGATPKDHLLVDVGTAGSVTLVMQALMIPLVRSPHAVTVEITGGTHVAWSPPVEYFQHVFSHCLRRMGCELTARILRHGFYPAGGGRVRLEVGPCALLWRDWTDRGSFEGCCAWSVASKDLARARVAERQVEAVRRQLELDEETLCYVASDSTGSAVFACARYAGAVLGASALGQRGKRAEQVGTECARALIRQMRSGACLDEHMADQILPYMALAKADGVVSVAAVTDHCRTNMWVIEQFLPVLFEVDEERRTITCRHERNP